jgi:antitoxin component YwqK of YwqJK toxin-antitoxin module
MGRLSFLFLFSLILVKVSCPQSINKIQAQKINITDSNGLAQGYWKVSMPDQYGHIGYNEGFFYNGKTIGVWKRFDMHRRVIEKKIFADTSDTDIELCQYDYDNGILRGRGSMKYFPANDTINIPNTDRSLPDSSFIIDHLLKKDGLWTYYFSNGWIESIGKYKEDKKVGQWRYYDINGQLLRIE